MPTEIDDYSSTAPGIPDGQFQPEGNVYSWGKTARLKIEPAYLQVHDTLKGDLVVVDLCSSYPHLRQIMTGRHQNMTEPHARKASAIFIDNLHHAPARKNKLPFSVPLEAETLAALIKTLAPKDGLARQLLDAAVFDICVNPPPASKRCAKVISENLFEKFMRSDQTTEHVIEPNGGRPKTKGNWVFIRSVNKGVTLQEILEPVLKDKTPGFLWDVASYFGSHLEEEDQTLRKVTFISLDIAPFEHIVADAKKAFPPKMQNTLFFKSAQETGRHVQANILHIPFDYESVSFFSSIEGWPYWGLKLGLKGNLAVASQIPELLVTGGKAVFFPWKMETDNVQTHRWLDTVESAWRKSGLTIEKQGFTRDEILHNMTDRELVLAQHSPLLRQAGILTSLTLSKAA